VLAAVLTIANPAVVVIGGSVASLPGFRERVEAVARDAAPTWAPIDLVVDAATTDHQQGAVGAATAAFAALDTVTTLARKDA
jgi:predicted NBD/HSP70 family sugar kinase